MPRWKWWPILQLILLRRPAASAAKYRHIWDPVTGSPLLHWTRRQTELLQQRFPNVPVRFGMQVGNPPVAHIVDDMIRSGVDRLIVLPMYPQYSATTTASATDVLFAALLKQRRVPALRIVPPYYEHPAYLDAVTARSTRTLAKLAEPPDHYVLSFHGIPIEYSQRGDPYATHVKRTTSGLIQRLGWRRGVVDAIVSVAVWPPALAEALHGGHAAQLGQAGRMRRVFVAMPGFTADCLETVDEIGREAREAFLAAGGEQLHVCPCLNDHPAWIEALTTIIRDEGQGWL